MAPIKLGEVRDAERAAHGKPLDGIRILALEQMQALPFATQLLAQMGAEVVKVEEPRLGDAGRMSRPTVTDTDGRSVGATFLRTNLCKRSLGINLKTPEGVELIRRLAPRFDVVAENLRPGLVGELGIDAESIRALDKRIIYVSVSGFGNTKPTPYGHWPAYAPIAEAMAGLYEPNRRGDEPPPVVTAGALGDNAAALYATIGLLAALQHRQRTGEGQYVDISMYDSMVGITDMVPFMWSMGEPPTAATAQRTGLTAAYRAKDGHFVLAVFREHQFEKVCALIGHPEWVKDPRFATREGWAQHREGVVRPAIEAWAADKTKLECARILCDLGLASGPSNEAADIAADPHIEARSMLIEVERPDAGDPMLLVGNPVKMSHMAEGPYERFPRVGEHTDEVLREELGLEDARLEELRAAEVIGPLPKP